MYLISNYLCKHACVHSFSISNIRALGGLSRGKNSISMLDKNLVPAVKILLTHDMYLQLLFPTRK